MVGTTVARILLGRELTRLRESASVSRPAAAEHINRKLTHLAYIEGGRSAPSDRDELRQLCGLYHADSRTVAELEQLWDDAKKDTWFGRFGPSERVARYIGLETDAETIRSWELENIAGLLQTEAYIRALLDCDPTMRSRREIDNRVILRLMRQQRLTSDDPVTLFAVTSEAALLRCVNAGSVGRAQLQHLHSRAALPSVEFRILPMTYGLHPSQDGAFSLLSFPGQILPDILYEEGSITGHFTEAPAVVGEYHVLFDELRRRALTPAESVRMLDRLLEEKE